MFFNNIDICRQYCTDCLIHIWYKFQNLYTKYRCTCSLCQKELLADAIEYRCCREVGPTLHQLVFDASIERISCVTLHEDYIAMTHPTVLKNVGPLLKDKDGRSYKRRTGQHENE